jgi:hypothetical protein
VRSSRKRCSLGRSRRFAYLGVSLAGYVIILYFINYRRHLNLFIKQFPSIKVEAAIVIAIKIK